MGQIILRLDRVMADRKTSLNDLAEKVGVARQTIVKWEAGESSPDLAAAEKIPDGAWLQDPEQVRRLLERGARYSRPFPVSQALLDGDRVWLRCQGLDGLARISVNGMEVGRADNMHRVWEYSIKRVLHPGINEITVELSFPPEGRLRLSRGSSPRSSHLTTDLLFEYTLTASSFGQRATPQMAEMISVVNASQSYLRPSRTKDEPKRVLPRPRTV